MPNHVIYERLWSSRKLGRCSKLAALAYPWIYLIADDWGRFEMLPRIIWGRAFGGRTDVPARDVARWLAEYEEVGLMVRYKVREVEVCLWTGFRGRPKSKRRPSNLPEPPGGVLVGTDSEGDTPKEDADLFPDEKPKRSSELEVDQESRAGVQRTDSGAQRQSQLEALADEVVACWNTRRDNKADAKRSASHVALVDKLDKAKYRREEVLLVALVAAHHEQGKWYRGHSGNEGLLIALGLGGRPRTKDGVVTSLTKNHFAALLEAPPLEYGPQMAVLLEAKGLTEAARERGWKLRAA